MENTERHQLRLKKLLVALNIVVTFVYYGAIFGWGPMQLLLEENGSFSDKCTPQEQQEGEICPEQTTALVNIQLYSMVTQLAAPAIGEIADRYGPAALSYFLVACASTGTALLLTAVQTFQQLLYPAFILLGLATWGGNILNTLSGMNFDGQTQSRIIFALNSVWDCGAIFYLGLYALYDRFGVSLTALAAGYFAAAVILFAGISLLWRLILDQNVPEKEKGPTEAFELSHDELNPVAEDNAKETDTSAGVPPTPNTQDEPDTGSLRSQNHQPEDADQIIQQEPTAYIPVAERSPRRQLTSTPFVLLAVFFTIQVLANQFYMSTTRDFLASLGDDELDNQYLKIFTILMPASLLALPFVDLITVKFGFHGGFQCVNILAIGNSLIRLLSTSLNVQVLGFLLFSFFRCFLFSLSFSFVPVILAPRVVGKACGVLLFLVGLLSYINIPLARYANETQDGDFFVPTLLYTILIAPCILAAWGIGRCIQQEKTFELNLLLEEEKEHVED